MGSIDTPMISGDTLDIRGDQLLVCGHEEKDPVRIFDLAKRELLTILPVSITHNSSISNIYSGVFMRSGSDLSVAVSSSHPNFVRFIEPLSIEEFSYVQSWQIDGFQKGVYSIHSDHSGKLLAIGGGDKHISLINVKSSP